MLIDELRKANIEALKNRDKEKRAIYSVVINRYDLLSKEKKCDDVDLAKIINKVKKELKEEKEGYLKAHNEAGVKSIEMQEKALEPFTPQMLTRSEIREIILKLPDKSMKYVMSYFKNNYEGRVDMAIVRQVHLLLWDTILSSD